MGANSLIVGSTILAYGASTRAFAYHSSVLSGGVYTPWYTYGGYWETGSTYSNGGYTPPASVNVGSGYSLATSKGGAQSSTTSMAMVYTITVASNGNGTVAGGGQVITGGSIGISATPNSHYSFSQWSDANTSASRTLTSVTSDATLAANFVQSEWQMYAASENTAQGTVSLSGWTTGAWLATGVTKTATATPKTGYKFLGWYRTGQTLPDYTTATASLLMYSANTTYTAKFTSTQFTLTVSYGTGGTVSSTPESGSVVTEGAQVTITATPAYNYTFASWSGLTGAGASYTFYMPSANLSTTASFAARPSFPVTVTKENPSYGTISITSVGGTVSEVGGSLSATFYTNISYTMHAVLSNSTLYEFVGWKYNATGAIVSTSLDYESTPTGAPPSAAFTAVFAQRASYTLLLLATDGSTNTSETNPAYVAGCRILQNRNPDFNSPDRWLADGITITATPVTGWRVAGWGASNRDNGSGLFQNTTGINPLNFTLSCNTQVICAFEKIPVTAACNVHSASSAAGTVEVSFGLESGESVAMRYGDEATFSATPEAAYLFAGWYSPDGTLVSSNASYTHVMTGDLTLTAKFSSTVSLSVAHSVAADDTGTVKINGGTAGSSVSASVVLGGTCVIKAVQTAGSIFDSWYLASDSGFATPLEGYLDEYTIIVTGPTSLKARFLGVSDLEDRYLAVLNYNNNTSSYDPLLGILSATIAGTGTEITQAAWESFTGSAAPTGLEPGTAGYHFYKFTGSKATTVSAISNTSLGFMQWKSLYLIPIVPTPEAGQPQFTASSPVVIGTSPSVSIVTNRHYMLTAVWGDPIAVDVSVKFADGCDESNGGFSMTPITANRLSVQGGITDKYLQGAEVVLSAEVENGYVFSGWFYDRAATNLASTETTFTHEVLAPTEFYAKFAQDTDAIYKWEGDTVNKMASWRSKRFMASKPFNPSSARVYADAYPVTLSIYMSSSPDAPSALTPTVSLYARNQDGFRLPMARPEKYIEIELRSQHDVTEAVVSTSMEGLSK